MKYRLRFIFLSLFLTVSFFASSQVDDCYKNMRTGTFTYTANGQRVVMKRTKTKEIETVGKYKFVGKITWISDTEYTVTMTKIPYKGCLKVGDVTRSILSDCDGKTYLSTISADGCPSGSVTLTKIK